MDELGSVIGGKIKAKSKILLTDACHSGAITPEDTESLNKRFGDLSKSLFSLTASRARERSYEVADLKGGHGVFTYYVVQGMEGAADSSGDGIVTADELAEYVHTQVREYTESKQNPTSDKANYDPEMLLAYVPSKAKPASGARAQVRRADLRSQYGWRGGLRGWQDHRRARQGQARSAFPASLPASTPCRASRWATSPMGRARRWSTPARNRPSVSVS